MPMPTGVKSPYGNNGQDLAKPSPNANLEQEMLAAMQAPSSGPAMPQGDQQAPAPAEQRTPSENEFLAAMGLSPDQATQGGPIQMAPEPTFAEANFTPQGISNQISDAYNRFRYAFTVTDREAVNDLKKSGAYADVKKSEDGDILIKRKGSSKYERFDKKTFELLNDFVDQTRIGTEMLAEAGGAVAGGVTGALTSLGLGTVPGAALGAASAGVIAQQANDAFAQHVLGIERDPTRSRLKEGALTATFSGVFGGVGAALARRSANVAARKSAMAMTEDVVRQNIDDAAEAVKTVQASGIKLDNKTGKFFLDPQQLAGDQVPEFAETFKVISTDPRVRAMRTQQGKILTDAFDSITQMVGNTTGKAVGKVKNFAMSVDDLRKFEGSTIGQYRAQALANTKGVPQPVSNFASKLNEVAGQFLGNVKNADDIAELAKNALPELSEKQAKSYLTTVDKLSKLMQKNGNALKLDVIDGEYKNLTNEINRLMKSSNGRDLGIKLIDLKNALRDDWIKAIGNNIPPEAMEKYTQAVGKYHTVMKGSEELGRILKNDNVPLDVLAETIFKGGLGKGDQVKAVKTLLNEADPNAWRDLTGQYMISLQNKFKTPDGINWNGFRKTFNNLSSDVRAELLEGTGVDSKLINALSDLGESVKKVDVGFTPTTKQRGLIKRAVYLMANQMASAKIENAEGLINGLGKDKAVGIWLKEGGAMELLNSFGGSDSRYKKVFKQFMDNYMPQTARQVIDGAAKAAPIATRRQGIDTLRPLLGNNQSGDMSTEQP